MSKVVTYMHNMKILPQIVKLMNIDNYQIVMPCLRILGGFVSKNASTTQAIIDSGALDVFPMLLTHPMTHIRREVAWIVSNIAAGTLIQLEALVEKDYLKILGKLLKTEEMSIKKEAVWAICNFSLVSKNHLIEEIFADKILELTCYISKNFTEHKYIAVSLESLSNLLKIGATIYRNTDGSNPVCLELEKLGMLDLFEQLQLHESEVVYEKVKEIIELYFEIVN